MAQETVIQFEGDPEAVIFDDFWEGRNAIIERTIQHVNRYHLQLEGWRWRFGQQLTLLFGGPEFVVEMWNWNPDTKKSELMPSYERQYIERALESLLPQDPRDWSPRKQA